MLYFLLVQCSSVGSLIYRDSNQVVVGCTTDFSGEVLIPRIVTEIYSYNYDSYAFMNCKTQITSLKFEENGEISKISFASFFRTSLESVNFSSCTKLTKLNTGLFQLCYNLKSVILPPNVLIIEQLCFAGNKNLTSIQIPDSVVNISMGAFSGCSLTAINISLNSSLQKLDGNCFDWNKINSFYITKNLKDFNPLALGDCPIDNITVDPENLYFRSDFKSVYNGTNNSTLLYVIPTFSGDYIVPNFITSIFKFCFYKCEEITSIQLNNKITSISIRAFHSCSSIRSFKIPKNVTKIEDFAFGSCKSLTNILMPENLLMIGDYVFYQCISLQFITIPGKVTSIGFRAFQNCTNLKTIAFLNNIISFNRDVFIDITNPMEIYIPYNFSVISYQTDKLFPYKSHLYITSDTLLSDKCKNIFGKKSVYIHMGRSAKFAGETKEVIDYIAIEIIYQQTKHECVYEKTNSLYLAGTLVCINGVKYNS